MDQDREVGQVLELPDEEDVDDDVRCHDSGVDSKCLASSHDEIWVVDRNEGCDETCAAKAGFTEGSRKRVHL